MGNIRELILLHRQIKLKEGIETSREAVNEKTKTKSTMASRLSHSPQRNGAALISVPRP